MKNLFSFGTYPFENFYLNNSSSLTEDDFSHILSDIHVIAPYVKFDDPTNSIFQKSTMYSSKTKQLYIDLEKHLTTICSQKDAINNIILLCIDRCSPYKYPFAYLNEHNQPAYISSPLHIFEEPCFIEDEKHMLKLSWLYNLSTKNSPKSLSAILKLMKYDKKTTTKKFTNCFYKTKSDFVASYSCLYEYWEKESKNRQKATPACPPLCIYDSISTQEEMLFKTDFIRRQTNFKIDSKYDLPLIFGFLRNRMANDPLFHIYGNDRIKGFQKSFNSMLYLDKFFPIEFSNANNELRYSSIFSNYFIERFTNINLINQFFNPSVLGKNPPYLLEPLFLLALHPLINFRLFLLKVILSFPKERLHTYLDPILKTILHQTFFYFPLLQTLFHLCMLIANKHLPFSPNQKLIFPKNGLTYQSYLETFNLSDHLLFIKDNSNTIQPAIAFPDMTKTISFIQDDKESSVIQKDLHTYTNHSIFKLTQRTLCNIKDMDFMNSAFDYHHTRTSLSFPESLILGLELTEISALMSFNQSDQLATIY